LRFGAKNEMNPKKSPQRRGNEVTNVVPNTRMAK
jgi:hypothetical protein